MKQNLKSLFKVLLLTTAVAVMITFSSGCQSILKHFGYGPLPNGNGAHQNQQSIPLTTTLSATVMEVNGTDSANEALDSLKTLAGTKISVGLTDVAGKVTVGLDCQPDVPVYLEACMVGSTRTEKVMFNQPVSILANDPDLNNHRAAVKVTHITVPVTVFAEDTLGSPWVNATITIYDASMNVVTSGKTDASGKTTSLTALARNATFTIVAVGPTAGYSASCAYTTSGFNNAGAVSSTEVLTNAVIYLRYQHI